MAQDAGIGAGVDSYFEYLVKGAILLQDKELMAMFLGKKGRIRGLLMTFPGFLFCFSLFEMVSYCVVLAGVELTV